MTDEDAAVCPSCKQAIPFDRIALHLEGLDGARPECPRQDLAEIAARNRGASAATWTFPRRLWR